jgi:hypothetical protein
MASGYRQSVFVPDRFRELASQLDRSVNWLAQVAFEELCDRHCSSKPYVKEKGKQNASSDRNRRR